MKILVLALIICVILSVICGYLSIPILRKVKAGQPILHYVKTHESKNGTPTMGGLFFILPSAIIFVVLGGLKSNLSAVVLSIGLAYLIVGFLDDFIKVRFKKNEGLKAYQKIIFQICIAIIAGIYAKNNGFSTFYLPFLNGQVKIEGIMLVIVVSIIFLAITNSVNLTDGLDGLAGQVSWIYLAFLVVLTYVQREKMSILFLDTEEYDNLILLSVCLIGGILGFLFFNVSKARVFMGDTGSLSLGGFIGGLSIFSLNSFFIPLLGIMFVLSSISVIIQVIYFKKTKKRVFLMAPIHHHFQLKGYTETQIGYAYALITAVCGLLAILQYL